MMRLTVYRTSRRDNSIHPRTVYINPQHVLYIHDDVQTYGTLIELTSGTTLCVSESPDQVAAEFVRATLELAAGAARRAVEAARRRPRRKPTA